MCNCIFCSWFLFIILNGCLANVIICYLIVIPFQAVSLVASYLKVPLRYPLRLGGSRSYIVDHAPSLEPSLPDSSSNSALSLNVKHVEFPLYLDGQDTTKAAYAVFLLNKVCFSFTYYVYALLCSRSHNEANVELSSLLAFFNKVSDCLI